MQCQDGEISKHVYQGRHHSQRAEHHLSVRHSLWEQDSLEAYNEVLFGYLDNEVGALRQWRAEYCGARRLSGGSDSCWSD